MINPNKFYFLTAFLLLSVTFFGQSKSKGDVYTVVEVMPEPPGGIQAFYKYMAENIHYPDSARVKGISGKVFLQFVVHEDGSLNDVVVVKGMPNCPDCDAEAARVVESYPSHWKPGKQGGRAVKVFYNLPVSFKLSPQSYNSST